MPNHENHGTSYLSLPSPLHTGAQVILFLSDPPDRIIQVTFRLRTFHTRHGDFTLEHVGYLGIKQNRLFEGGHHCVQRGSSRCATVFYNANLAHSSHLGSRDVKLCLELCLEQYFQGNHVNSTAFVPHSNMSGTAAYAFLRLYMYHGSS